MNEQEFIKDYENSIQQIVEADTTNFFELAEIANLDILTDFAGADISKVSLREGKLKGANFRGTDLSFCNLSYADLSNADLSSSNLSYADLSGANLSEANLEDAKVEYATFKDNLGLSEKMKLNLFHRAAIIEESSNKPKEERVIEILPSTELLLKEGMINKN